MSRSVSEVSVLIVGAGPTGLTLACDLARRNVDFRLVDKSPAYFVGSRGKGLQPRTLEVLDDLGVVDRILGQGRFHLPFRGYEGTAIIDHDLYEGHNPTPSVPYASPLIIPQWRVEETLRQLLHDSGKEVELQSELVWIDQDEDGVTATLQKDEAREQVRCKYLVAADGGHSFVRKFMKFGFEGETWENARMFVGDVRVDGLDHDHWHSWPHHPHGWLGLCPLPSTPSFQFQAGISPETEEEPSLAGFQRIVDKRTGRPDLKLSDPTWLSLYRVNIRMVNRFRMGRIFLAGDAAHVHSPAGGQGMNTGMQDSYNLGWKLGLVLHGARESLLDTYEEERLPVAASVLGITTRLSREFQARGRHLPRNSETLQLGINYRYSSLSHQQNSSLDSLAPGDRAPDGPLLDSRGNRLRLFDLFRGPRFTLLSIGATGLEPLRRLGNRYKGHLQVHEISTDPLERGDSQGALREDGGHISDAYGAKAPLLALIRSDGYICWLGEPSSLAAAESCLKSILGV